MLKISLVIVTYNGKNDTLELLQSLKKTDYPIHETILVDNGSVDGTIKAVRHKFPKVIIIDNKSNLGISAAWNVGIRASTGNYVMLLPNDMVVYRADWLTKLAEVMETDGYIRPAMLATTNFMDYDNPDRLNTGIDGYRYHYKGELYKKFTGDVFDIDYVIGLINKKVFEEIGLFDEKFFCYYEDADFGYRAKKAGYRLVVVTDSRLLHKGGTTVEKLGSYFRVYHSNKGKLRLILKHYSFGRKIILSTLNVGHCILRTVYHKARGENELSRAFADAIAWNIRNLGDYI